MVKIPLCCLEQIIVVFLLHFDLSCLVEIVVDGVGVCVSDTIGKQIASFQVYGDFLFFLVSVHFIYGNISMNNLYLHSLTYVVIVMSRSLTPAVCSSVADFFLVIFVYW